MLNRPNSKEKEMKKTIWLVLLALQTTLYSAADPLPNQVPREVITCSDVWGGC